MTRHSSEQPARRNKPALPEKDERLTRRAVGNYTRLDSALLDELLPVMGLAECKVVIAAIRKIEGWNKTEDAISLTQFAKLTGLNISSVREGIAAAVARGVLIEVAPATRTRAAIYSLAYPALADEQPAAPRPKRMTHEEMVAVLMECVFDNGTALDERGRVITAQRIGREAKELRKLLPDCTPEEIRESAAWHSQTIESDSEGYAPQVPHTARKIAELVKDYRAALYADEQPAVIASDEQSPAIQRPTAADTPNSEQPTALDTAFMLQAIRKQTSLDDSYISAHIPGFIAWCEKHKPETTITRENVNRLWHDFFDELIPF